MGAAPVRGGLAVMALCVGLSGCVGASRTAGDYEAKAANSAEAVRSAVETARLVVGAVEAGDAPGPYTSRTLSDMERDVGSVVTQFGSVQPPGRESDELRDRVVPLLTECHSALSTLRIAARRGSLDALPGLAEKLPALSARLRTIEELTAR